VEKKKIKLLYVEDEDMIREAIGRALGRIYEDVILCQNGEEGFNAFLEHSPDIVLTDIEMPILNGRELVLKIKAIKPELPCVVLTAYKDPKYLVETAEATLYKPVVLSDLIRTIDKFLTGL
jgi:YesN/AraC family two-component response regulator